MPFVRMVGLLSLTDELIELVGEHIITRYPQENGIREWCRVTSACRRLWNMQLPGSAFEWSLNLDNIVKGAPWILQRIQSTRKLTVRRWTEEEELELDVLHQTVKAMIRTSIGSQNLTTLELDICEGAFPVDTCPVKRLLQRWAFALLFGSPKLTSLSMEIDDVFCPPELGLLSLRHLELTMCCVSDRLPAILADLRHSQIESLVLASLDDCYGQPSSDLPDIVLHEVATLKSVEVRDLHPEGRLTLPPGCLFRLSVVLERRSQWLRWQKKGCPTSMLHLVYKKLRAWPVGLQEMPGLQFLELHCTRMQDQDLAALQHIPHVCLEFTDFSTLLLTSGSWQSLQIKGKAGFSVSFSSVSAFVGGTKRFLFECTGQDGGEMYQKLCAACLRQGVACHECEHTHYSGSPRFATLSNVQICKEPKCLILWESHERLIHSDGGYWPSKAAFPELYR